MIKELAKNIFSLFYPNLCAGCGNDLVSSEKIICITCMETLPKTNFHLREKNEIEQKFWGKINITHATAFYYFNKESRLQAILHALKYKKEYDIGILLGQKMGVDLLYASWINDIDILVPIPLSKEKIHKRGFNQSESIAEGLSAVINLPINKLDVVRIKNTETQTNKNVSERYENVKDAFDIKNKDAFTNKHILLVDDVLTTGATIEACAKKILMSENAKVSIACLAFAIE